MKAAIVSAVLTGVILVGTSAYAVTLVNMCYRGVGMPLNVKVDSTKVAFYQARGYTLGTCPVSPSH